MLTRIVSLVLLVTFLNSIIGCTKLVRVPVNELPKEKHKEEKKVTEVVLEKITEAILETGEVVKFNSTGARLLRTDVIVGKDIDGRAVGVPLQQVREIRVSKPETVNKEDAEGKKIVEAIFFDGEIVKFDDSGGKYDSTTGKITGHTEDGTLIERSIDSFREFRISILDIISRDSLRAAKGQHIVEITIGSSLIPFDDDGGRFEEDKLVIAGITQGGRYMAISLDNISSVEILKDDKFLTAILGIGVGIGLVIALVTLEFRDFWDSQ